MSLLCFRLYSALRSSSDPGPRHNFPISVTKPLILLSSSPDNDIPKMKGGVTHVSKSGLMAHQTHTYCATLYWAYSFIFFRYNVVAFFFFLVLLIPDIGTEWMNYVLIIATFAGLPLIYFTRNPKDEGTSPY